MIAEKTLMKFGLIKDENNFKLKEIFKHDTKLKEIHVDIYSENPLINSSLPFMLLLRAIEKNIIVVNDKDRLIVKSDSKYETYLMNVLFSEIIECYYKLCNDHSEFILNIKNIYYRIIVFN